MPEDGQLLALQVAGAERHRTFDHVGIPFLPGPAVQPHVELLPLGPDLADGREHRIGTGPVGAVRVGQLTRYVDLSRLQPPEQCQYVGDVLRVDGGLGDGAGAVKSQVHEFELLGRDAAGQRRGAGLGLAHQLLDAQEIFGVGLAGPLAPQEILNAPLDRLGLLAVDLEHLVEFGHEVGEAPGVVVEDRDVAAGHVGDVDLVALLHQADQRAAHADHVVVGVRAEHQGRRGRCAAGMGADRLHQLVEHLAAQALRRAVLAEQLVQLVFAEIVVGQLQEGFADLQAQPDHRPADEGRRPVDGADHPGPHDRRQLLRPGVIEQKGRVVVLLQEAGGDGLGHVALDGPRHNGRFVLAEPHEDDLAGLQDGADAHRDGLLRHVVFAEKAAGGVAARHRVERHQARSAVARRARLVEADVPGAADAEDLQVDAARPAD